MGGRRPARRSTGIEPHVRLNYPESFYDRESLVEMIHNLK